MSTSPARMTSALIILLASAMSVSRSVNSPLASGWRRSCCRMNWARVRGFATAAPSPRVRSRLRARAPRPAPRPPPGTCRGRTARAARRPRAADGLARRRGHAPQLALVGADRLLAGLVEELLVGVAGLALVGGQGAQALVDLVLELRRERGVIEHHALEIGREVDLARPEQRELVEQLDGQVRGPVLH